MKAARPPAGGAARPRTRGARHAAFVATALVVFGLLGAAGGASNATEAKHAVDAKRAVGTKGATDAKGATGAKGITDAKGAADAKLAARHVVEAKHAVDANTASADELQTIRGIGPATAARIVEARQREPFRDLDDLRSRVRGIGEKKLRRMQEAGLGVGSGNVTEGPGQGRVIEPAVAQRIGGVPRVERYVGRPR